MYDISSQVPVPSFRSVSHTGPAFRCPAHDTQQETQLSRFPEELLTEELSRYSPAHSSTGTLTTPGSSRMRTRFLEHLEQHLHDVINSAVTMVTEKKEVIRLEQQLHLKQMSPEHIKSRVYQPRLGTHTHTHSHTRTHSHTVTHTLLSLTGCSPAELLLHHQCVELHCQQLRAVVASSRAELQELQTSTRRRNDDFVVMVTNMEPSLMTRNSSQM